MSIDGKRRGPGPLAAVSLLLLLAGTAWLTVELIQRYRFDQRRLDVESLMLLIQARLTFQMDKAGTLRIPEAGQTGAPPVVSRGSATYRGSRFVSWAVTIPVGTEQKRVMHLTLAQERSWFLSSPFIVITDTRDCDASTVDALRLMVGNQGLNQIARIGF